jgi:capsular exopolysaccharide synthesis family protein
MSEIFDFLKKTEAERRKEPPVPVDMPIREPKNPPMPEAAAESAPSEQLPLEVEICGVDRFDLTKASLQVKSVLDPLTLVGEQFRLLRSRLSLMQKQNGIKTILVTSSIPGEGKTFTACGLAGVFAQEPGKRIILIDADMRKAKSGWNFGLNGSAGNSGLSEVLRGKQEFHGGLLMSTNPEFYFMPSGPLPSNPSELLSTQNLEQTLRTAAESFDWVIVDSPPVLSLSDTSLLSPLCDTVILVVRASSTPSKLVLEAINRLGRDRICGVVLNRQKQVRSSRYYYQYYYRSSKRDKE